jgi:hypothetical protein
MPEFVVKYKNNRTEVQPYVLSAPEGASDADVAERVAALGDGWSLDKKTDPADLPPADSTALSAAKEK